MTSSEIHSLESFPLVTVFTLIYNTNPKFVIEAIESIRANNYPNIQHIIIDDCSPNPEPKRVVKQWIDRENYPCEFYEHEVNYGVCKTLNQVLELAKGKYIFGCSDDIISFNKIFTEIEILESLNDSFAATYSDAFIIDENGKFLKDMFISKNRIDLVSAPSGEIFYDLCNGNFLPMMSMMFKTELIKKIGGFDERLEYEDFDLHLRLFKQFKIYYIDSPLSFYRVHSSSLVNNINNLRLNHFIIFSKHLDVDVCLRKVKKIQFEILITSSEKKVLKDYKIKNASFWSAISRIFNLLKIKNKAQIFHLLTKMKLIKW
jgi:GT2 family glycosyltransferase